MPQHQEGMKPLGPTATATLIGTMIVAGMDVLSLPWILATSVPGTIGSSYIGVNAAILLAVVWPLLPLFVQFQGWAQVWWWNVAFYAMLGLCVLHRVASAFNREHSHYVGRAFAGFPGQLILAACSWWLLAGTSPQMAALLPISFAAKQIHLALIDHRYRRVKRRLRDHGIEAGHINDITRDI